MLIHYILDGFIAFVIYVRDPVPVLFLTQYALQPAPAMLCNTQSNTTTNFSQLNVVVQQAHFLTRLERWESNIRAPVASEGITQGAIPTAAYLALHCEVDLGKVICVELEAAERLVRGRSFGGVFGFDFLLQAARAVFAGASPLSGLGLAFGRCAYVSRGRGGG